ncbi:NUDIX domain-containing protein [Nocardioides sp. zg-578]|uniref:NUDIX domain-containing protein n=1 Tax=Nocardioides marmotae TaxID=2663857 RepID=A0A6I3JF25_9ACTN|nr:NUDIX domain-containing protein [Nocardioides marmotae]MCR6033191.1 NUDIX domain-containing protein [Gordonia jinghuaiqii]MTB83814.1 NUDIX domain-containing protein [Nocardioides marmotae]MTB96846.1 NUDIX domain-containing protein [Nocardioides marmotae]QKE03684.1 NUDIX domain-containing protein [Nocardioides marmotae]
MASYAVITDDEGRILLALWNESPDGGRWTLPGGGVDLEETAEQGAVREVREETGYDVRLDRLLTVDSYVIPASRRHIETDRPMKAVRVLFAATITGGELTAEIGGSTDEARWFTPAEAARLPHVSLVDLALDLL